MTLQTDLETAKEPVTEAWIDAWTAIRTSSQTRTHMFGIIILTETEA